MNDPTKIFALSKIFHERARLGIMTFLVAQKTGADFNEMLRALKLTKGNFAIHISKLEEAGYVEVIKEIVDRSPRTLYKATTLGIRDFSAYLALLEDIISNARKTL